MLCATCHCGDLRITVPRRPRRLTSCNCSMCRRLGTLWAYYRREAVTVVGHPGLSIEYIQGDRMLRTIRCRRCGCVMHWEAIDTRYPRCGVNMRNFEPAVLGPMKLRFVDGAETWTSVEWP